MSKKIVFCLMVASLVWCHLRCQAQACVLGADVSFMKHLEDSGLVLKDSGVPLPGTQILKNHGYTWVRLRLFHSPRSLPNSLAYTIASARQAKQQGFKILLDVHFSDTWADPSWQEPPAAWANVPVAVLADSVRRYTRATLLAMRKAGVYPDMVQLGNEVDNGLLWPHGRFPHNHEGFILLMKAASRGVVTSSSWGKHPRIMIHSHQGTDSASCLGLLRFLRANGVAFDVVGLSYYPWWQGSLNDLKTTINAIATSLDLGVFVVETAYSYMPGKFLDIPGPFDETPCGQVQFLQELYQVVTSINKHRGLGIFWWEPASPLDACVLFDSTGNALPAVSLFK